MGQPPCDVSLGAQKQSYDFDTDCCVLTEGVGMGAGDVRLHNIMSPGRSAPSVAAHQDDGAAPMGHEAERRLLPPALHLRHGLRQDMLLLPRCFLD